MSLQMIMITIMCSPQHRACIHFNSLLLSQVEKVINYQWMFQEKYRAIKMGFGGVLREAKDLSTFLWPSRETVA